MAVRQVLDDRARSSMEQMIANAQIDRDWPQVVLKFSGLSHMLIFAFCEGDAQFGNILELV
jgi:hypothetical protein